MVQRVVAAIAVEDSDGGEREAVAPGSSSQHHRAAHVDAERRTATGRAVT